MKSKDKILETIVVLFIIFNQALSAQQFNCKPIYNRTDVTEGLQNAIDKGYQTIIIPYMGKDKIWVIGPLVLKSDTHISLEPGVIIQAKNNSVLTDFPLFMIRNVRNASISGGKGSTIRMPIQEYHDGEWRNTISILGSMNIKIENLEISKSGGDGIYISSAGQQNCSTDIKINNVLFYGNARNGISVISVKDLTISNCRIEDTGKFNSTGLAEHGPWAGIDFEPNTANQCLSDITVTNCSFSSNKRYGILIALNNLQNTSVPVGLKLSDINVKEGLESIGFTDSKGTVGGEVDVSNVNGIGLKDDDIYFFNWYDKALKISLNGIRMTRNPNEIPLVGFSNRATETSLNLVKTDKKISDDILKGRIPR